MRVKAYWKKNRKRTFLSFAAGLFVFITAFLCAYFENREHPHLRSLQRFTKNEIHRIHEKIKEHQREKGKLPLTLAPLRADYPDVNEKGEILDPYGHPYQYLVENGEAVVYSYGGDGQPGGKGLDADLYSDRRYQNIYTPTLWQFTMDLPTENMFFTCLFSGVVAFAICYFLFKKRPQTPSALGTLIVGIFITLAMCIMTAVAMTTLHLPSGH